jgi:hypothetical protein
MAENTHGYCALASKNPQLGPILHSDAAHTITTHAVSMMCALERPYNAYNAPYIAATGMSSRLITAAAIAVAGKLAGR